MEPSPAAAPRPVAYRCPVKGCRRWMLWQVGRGAIVWHVVICEPCLHQLERATSVSTSSQAA
ncbi:MAG: hypothetical protein KY469_10855 [Actinobacteria bacterium]|nr:hypothetical protein [Actinomycetota bacterium]